MKGGQRRQIKAERGSIRGKSRKQKKKNTLTVEAGEVAPVEQRAVEGGQRAIEERVRAVGRVSDGVGEQVHLQQRLEQVAQHLAAHGDLREALPPTTTLALLTSVLSASAAGYLLIWSESAPPLGMEVEESWREAPESPRLK